MDYEKDIKKIVFEYIPAEKYKVFLFGSRAKQTNRKYSDYDIGLLNCRVFLLAFAEFPNKK